MWLATLFLLLALFYVIFPWDLDFVPVVGRIDDLIVVLLALYYYWKKKKIIDRMVGSGARRQGAGPEGSGGERGTGSEEGENDPYRILGVDPGDDEQTVKRAYRELLGKYHPDRVAHLGDEFREMAARRTRAIMGAWQSIRESRDFS